MSFDARKARRRLAHVFPIACAAVLLAAPPSQAAIFIVTSTADSGAGTLRQAILDANATAAADTITFAIPGNGPQVIEPWSDLPAITQAVTIDGYSQPGASPNTLAVGNDAVIGIVLLGSDIIETGLTVAASDVTIRGLSVTRFVSAGIRLSGGAAVHTVLEGNFIGVHPLGISSGNGIGIAFGTVGGGPSQCRIGGALPAQRNVISGNRGAGISIDHDATFNVIAGNYIGVLPNGSGGSGNLAGIRLHGAGGAPSSFNLIGGATPGAANVISGNLGDGIALERAFATEVRGNMIGVAADDIGLVDTPQSDGWAARGHGISVGVDATSESDGHAIVANHIRHNRFSGVSVRAGSATRLSQNRIYWNGGVDIDLGDDGLTANDTDDSDGGPNQRQNFPVLDAVVGTGPSTATVTGYLASTPGTTFRVEFFSNLSCRGDGHGGGERYAGSLDVTTDGQGRGQFSGTITVVPGNSFVTATATSPAGSTSEFSACVVAPSFSFRARGTVTRNATPLSGIAVTLVSGTTTMWMLTDASGMYDFPVAPGAAYTVTPALPGHTFTPASQTITNVTTDTHVSFTASRPVSITGVLHDLNGGPLSGHAVSLAGTRAQATTTDAGGRYAFTELPAGGTYVVSASQPGFVFSPSIRTFTALVDDVADADGGFLATTGVFLRYFAEGATGPFFDTTLALLNPTNRPAHVTLTFQKGDGTTVAQPVVISPSSRATVNPEQLPGLESAEFSTVVTADVPVVADRSMKWDGRGYGSHAETSVAAPALTWYLAEGATIADFDLFYLVQNANDRAAEVRITYLRPSPEAPIVRTYLVPARSRFNVWVNHEDVELVAAEVSAVVEVTNDTPVIVERAMYRNGGAQVFRSGHASAGITAPATTWFLAEGNTGPFFDLFVLVANPTDVDAQVTATYLLPGGQTLTKPYVVKARSRFNIWVDEEELPEGSALKPLADTAVSTAITSTNGVPLIVERSMWWPGSPSTWHEGHNSAGVTAAGQAWALADGEVGGPHATETYILVANTSVSSAEVRLTLFFEDGTTAAETVFVAPTSRTNLDIGQALPMSRDRRFGALVESLTSGVDIVVERAMYSDADGVRWAAGTAAIATRLR